MDDLRQGDVSSSAASHRPPGTKHHRALVSVAFLAAVGPWVLSGDEFVGQTALEATIAGAALTLHSAVAWVVFFGALVPGRHRRYDYWLVTGLVTLVR